MKLKPFFFFAFVLLFSSCDEDKPEIKRGEFTIEDNTYSLAECRLIFETPTRILFTSESYPMEGVDVRDFHFLRFDFFTSGGPLVEGSYSFTGDSSAFSLVNGYGGADITVRDYEMLTGTIYEFNAGTITIKKNENYFFTFEVTTLDNEVLTGYFEGEVIR